MQLIVQKREAFFKTFLQSDCAPFVAPDLVEGNGQSTTNDRTFIAY